MQPGQMRGERSRGWSFSCRPGPDALTCSCASFTLVLSLSCCAALNVAFPVGGKTHEQPRKRGVHARCCRLIYFPLVRLSSPPALQDSGGWKRQHSQQNSPLEPRPLKIPDRSPQSRALGARTRTRGRKSLRGKQNVGGKTSLRATDRRSGPTDAERIHGEEGNHECRRRRTFYPQCFLF